MSHNIRFKDLSNQKFNSLLVISLRDKLNGRARWNCLCDCGNIIVVKGATLTSKRQQSCGCSRKGKCLKDISEKKFGYLTAKKFIKPAKDRQSIWLCICNCQKDNCLKSVEIKRSALIRGDRINCKCDDVLIGRHFDKLTVLEYSGNDKNRQTLWKCQCNCGNIKNCTTNALRKNKNNSCRECFNKLKSLKIGNQAPNWKSYLSEEDRKMHKKRGLEAVSWGRQIFKRDNYTCCISGQRGRVTPHHLYSWNKYKNLRYCLDNGVTIANHLHILFHRLYGYGDNTKEQFLEFKERYNSGEWRDYQI